MEVEKIQKVLEAINTVGVTLQSNQNISSSIKAAYTITTSEFIRHMSAAAISNPKRFSHVYEWNRTGDPNARLWRHVLRGGGKNRKAFFEFKASKTIVPVDPKLADVGVQRRHIFYWKAPVMEYGLPVRISPKVAKALVYLENNVKNPSSGNFKGYNRGGIIYRTSPVYIERAGSKINWGAFTQEYTEWWASPAPNKEITEKIGRTTEKVIKNVVGSRLKNINALRTPRTKRISIEVSNYDPTVGSKLQEALDNNYAQASRNRVMDEDG